MKEATHSSFAAFITAGAVPAACPAFLATFRAEKTFSSTCSKFQLEALFQSIAGEMFSSRSGQLKARAIGTFIFGGEA